MLKTIIDAVLVLLLILLAFSPAFIMNLIDKYIFNKENIVLFDRDIFNEPLENLDEYSGESQFNSPICVERDEVILNNLRRMVKQSKKKKVRQMWKHKLGEFERKLKWSATMEKAQGHEKLPAA